MPMGDDGVYTMFRLDGLDVCALHGRDPGPSRAQPFYTDVFGWRFESVGTPEQPYWGVFNGPGLNGPKR